MLKHSAVFLDRDGTIIEDRGYISNPSEITFIAGSIDALRKLQEGYYLFIITNQSGISKGITTGEEVRLVNETLTRHLSEMGVVIKELYCCPHATEDNCICKKPSPYFVNQAAEKYNLALSRSFIIGDHPSDVICGINAGIRPVYVLSGHGSRHLHEVQPGIPVVRDIVDATDYVLNTTI